MLLDQLRDAFRIRHYSHPTGKMVVHWSERSFLFQKAEQVVFRSPAEMGALGKYSLVRLLPEAMVLPIWESAPQRQILDTLKF